MRDPTATFDLALGARRDYALRLVTAAGSAPGVIEQLGVYVGETPLEVTRRQEGGRTLLEAVIPAALVSEGRAFTTLTLRTTGKVAFTRLQVTEITLN
jgi:hypothetical protein